jgi:PST family polysaccharide transporter
MSTVVKYPALRMHSSDRPIVATALQLYALQALNFLVPLLTLTYLLRVLGPQPYGRIAFAQALISYAVVVTDYSFPLTAARDISISRDNPEMVAEIFWTTLLAKTILFLVCAVVLSLVIAVIPECRNDWHVFAACSMLVVGNVFFPVWYLQGIEKLPQAALIQLISRCFVATGIFVFIRSPADVLLAALLLSGPLVLSGFTALAFRRHLFPVRFRKPKIADLRITLAGGWYVFVGLAAATLYLQTNAFVLGILSDKRSVAYFSVGYSVVLAVQGLSVPATQSVYPRLSLLFAKNPAQAWGLVKNLALMLLPLMAIASLSMAVFARPLVALMAGASYADCVPIIRVMAALPFMITMAAILGPAVMVNLNLSRQLMWIYVSIGALNILLLPYFVYKFAAVGAALALVIAETAGPIAMFGVLWARRERLSTSRSTPR